MGYLGSWKIDDALTFPAITHRFDTGALTDADAVPAYRVYEDETGTAILTGNMAKLDDTNTTGFYSEQITLSAANGFEKGKCYTVYITAAVNSVTGGSFHTFQLEAEVDANVVSDKTGYGLATGAITAAVIATDAIDADALADGAITSGVFASGAITADAIAANAIGSSEIADGAITAAKIATDAIDADALADGAITAATFAAGAITATVIATDAIDADALADNAITAATFAADAITAAKVAADVSAEIADAVWDEDATGHQTQGTFGQAIGDPAADANTIYGAVVTGAAGATIAADIVDIEGKVDDLETRLGTPSDLGSGATVAGNLVDIESQTDDIGVAGAGLTALASQASVNTIDDFLDTEVAAIKAKTDQLTFSTANRVDSQVFGMEANTVTAAAIAADAIGSSELAASAVAEIADQVWEEAIADHSGTVGSTAEALGAAGAAGDPWATALPGAYGAGSAGKIIGDNINATISSRATQTSVDDLPTNAELTTALGTADDAVLAQVALVKAKTDNLPADPADASDIASAFGTVNSALTTIDDFLDTEVAAIKAQTDKLTFDGDNHVIADARKISTSSVAADNLEEGAEGLVKVTIDTGSTTTAIVTTLTEATNDHYNGRALTFLTGALAGQATSISDYDGGSKTLTVVALTEAPAQGDTAVIS